MKNLVKEYVRALKLRNEAAAVNDFQRRDLYNDDLEYLKKQIDNAMVVTCTSLEKVKAMIHRELVRA